MADRLDRLERALADRDRIERELGAGGMATVYLAHDLKHDRRVAVKVLRPELAAVIGAERFLHEIKTTANLQHPHILPLHDSGTVEGTVFYVMPYVEGESLRDRLAREKQLPIDDALRIAKEVASALDYAHRRGVIHRDIKPENVLLHDGQAVVADFGIALAASSAGGARMTETGMSLGTPHYLSPEQAMGERALDSRTDIYALGCVLYENLTGEPPFTGPTAQAIVAKVLTSQPEPILRKRRTVPLHVDAATRVALEKLPADRFANAADFSAALNNPGFHSAAAHTTVLKALPLRPIPWLVGVAAIAAAIGAGITWSLRTPAPVPLVTRFELPMPDSVTTGIFGEAAPIYLTRDGRLLWFASSALYERSLAGLQVRPLRSADDARSMFIQDESPDGTELLAIWTTREGNPGAQVVTGRSGNRRDRLSVDTPRTWSIVRQRWDGSGPATAIHSRNNVLGETSWLRNGRGVLVLYVSGPGPSAGRGSGNVDIGLIAFDKPDSIQPIVSSPAYDGYPAISPDGRFLAYESDESGRTEVYVRPLTGGARRQVSRSGGSNPVWAWSGRELFFYGEGVLHAAKIQTSGELTVGEVVPLFSLMSAQYMPAPMPGDSQFVAFQAADETENKPAPIVVLVNLGEALRQLFASQKAKQ